MIFPSATLLPRRPPIRARLAALGLAFTALLPWLGLSAQTPDTPAPGGDPDAASRLVQNLRYQKGEISIHGGMAKLEVPDTFGYLDGADARKVLVDLWGNPPEAAEKVLGMLVPSGSPIDQQDSYGVIVSYEENGYVKDDDASKIDYNALLKQMQDASREHNAQRAKEGYPALDIVGWAAPPHYDAGAKKLYWAKELRVEGHQTHTLNYDIRILGRRGVLVLSAIASMDQLDQINQATPQILSMVNFQQGSRYADFDPKTDKVAAYGLAALVAGGILAKAGAFKLLIAALIAAKKFVVIGAVAIVGFFKRLFGGRKKTVDVSQALPPSDSSGS